MKKTILFSSIIAAIIAVIFSCDTRKFLKDSLPTPLIIIDSISFEIVKHGGDTIRAYDKRSASYSLTLKAYDKNKQEIKNTKVPFNISYIAENGINKIDNKFILKDSILLSEKVYSIEYYPEAKKNAYNIFVYNYTNSLGKTFTDTVKYFVYKYQPITFEITSTPSLIPFLRPSGTFDFKVNVNSQDQSNQMKYKIKFELANEQIKIYDSQNKPIGNTNDMILLLGDNKFTAKLSNHIAGSNYNIRMIVFDENDDQKTTLVSYTVKYNEVPIINNFSYKWDTIYRDADGGKMNGPIPAPIRGGPNCFNYTSYEFKYDLVLKINIDFTDDIETKKIVIKNNRGYINTIDLYNNTTSYTLNTANGTISFNYPNQTNADGGCFRAQAQQINYDITSWPYYSFTYGWQTGFAGIQNTGENSTTTNPTTFYHEDIISVYVIDGDGGESLIKTFQSNINTIKGPRKWHGINRNN